MISRSGISQNRIITRPVKELKNLGLVKGNAERTSVCYCPNIENWNNTIQKGRYETFRSKK